jgi:hypothetical protein
MVQNYYLRNIFCLFYIGHKKCLFTPKLSWMDIVCSDAYSEYFIQLFKFYEMHLKCTFIIEAFAPMSQNTMSIYMCISLLL